MHSFEIFTFEFLGSDQDEEDPFAVQVSAQALFPTSAALQPYPLGLRLTALRPLISRGLPFSVVYVFSLKYFSPTPPKIYIASIPMLL